MQIDQFNRDRIAFDAKQRIKNESNKVFMRRFKRAGTDFVNEKNYIKFKRSRIAKIYDLSGIRRDNQTI